MSKIESNGENAEPSFEADGDPGPHFKSIAFQLSAIGFAISSRFKNSLVPFDIEPRQFGLLRAVGFSKGQSQKTLAEQLHVPTSSMVATIDDLEQRGLIERHATTEDRRVRTLHLTKRGQDLLNQAMPVAMQIEHAIRETLDEEELAKLQELLGKINPLLGLTLGGPHPANSEH